MYLGRIVAVGLTADGRAAAMYRVSSRSFPNREAVRINDATLAIIPKAGFEADLRKNPYIAYNCLRLVGKYAVASNGSHTDPIAEKIAAGMPVRDAIALGLLAMDYEKDALDTPRIVAVIGHGDRAGYLGIVRKDAVMVSEFAIQPGEAYYISTYECNYTCPDLVDRAFRATDAKSACAHVLSQGKFAEFTNAVTAACAVADANGFELALVQA